MVSELDWKAKADLKVVYANEAFPQKVTKTLFLAGPTVRGDVSHSWRPEAIRILRELGFDGHVFCPEVESGEWEEDYKRQVKWEEEALHRADCIVFWVPRDITGDTYGVPMPGLTTNDEWGFWRASGKVVWGSPSWAEHVRYQEYHAKELGVPSSDTLKGTLENAIKLIGDGAARTGGETQVPLFIWRKPEFQAWLQAQKGAGNRLDGARVLWQFKPSPTASTFCYAVHVKVFIASENRWKDNEFVFGRPDVSSVLLYYPSDNPDDTLVVLVKEFRSPARNPSGFVYELPGGSSPTPGEDPKQVALQEVREEVGLELNPAKLVPISSRQMAATLSIHSSSLFAYELSYHELTAIKQSAGEIRGVESEGERTYVEVHPVRDVIQGGLVDWSTLGMIRSVV